VGINEDGSQCQLWKVRNPVVLGSICIALQITKVWPRFQRVKQIDEAVRRLSVVSPHDEEVKLG
jgi:hypothetical protein